MKNLTTRKTIIPILLSVLIMLGGVAVSADSFMQPEPFEIWSEDGTKVFKWNSIMEKDSAQAGVYQK